MVFRLSLYLVSRFDQSRTLFAHLSDIMTYNKSLGATVFSSAMPAFAEPLARQAWLLPHSS